MLELGLRNQQAAMRERIKTIQDQADIIEEQIELWQARQERLLDLYLDGKILVDV